MSRVLAGLRAQTQACRGILVDSNILLDISTKNARWQQWSADALDECIEVLPLIINPLIYAEVSVGYTSIEALDLALPRHLYLRESLPWDAGFLAGKCFLRYRQRGGTRTTPIPDFYIGAHAAISGLAVLTRDRSRFRTYFPNLAVLSPDSTK